MRPRSIVGGVVLGMMIATLAPLPAALAAPPVFSKVFAPDVIGPGSESTLTFVIDNSAEASPADELAFSDPLPAGVVIATPANASTTCDPDAGGDGPTVTAPAGFTTISLADAAVGAGKTCRVTVDVTSTTTGTHTNTSGPLMSSAGMGGTATDDLIVDGTQPGFAKDFSPDPIDKGERTTLTFTIDNSGNSSAILNLDFTDTLPAGLVVADPANVSTTACGTATLPPMVTAEPGSSEIILDVDGTGGFPAVAAFATCTVEVEVVATAAGILFNSVDLFADFDPAGKATATIDVLAADLHITKEFTDDPIAPGSTGTMEIVIENFDRDFQATAVSFSDTLPLGVTLGTPANASSDCGGTLVAPDGGTALSLSGGTIAAEGFCTITVDVTSAVTGEHVNTTGVVSGTVDGEAVTGNEATDKLFVVAAPKLTKDFTDDPVAAGDSVTLSFTIEDTTTVGGSTDITFIDELTDSGPGTGFLPFPVSVSLPPTPDPPCGPSSSLALVSVGFDAQGLELTGGELAAGADCTFTVTVDIPAGFPPGTYTNTTGRISATVDGMTVTGAKASTTIDVVSAPALNKDFTDDPIAPGDSVTLEFTLLHDPDSPADATGIGFTDDLSAVAAGLTLGSVDSNDCGGSVTGIGTTTITFSGGTLMPGESCTIVVTVDSTTSTPAGTHTNTTSDVSATVSGVAVTELPATDDLVVVDLIFTKEFTDDPTLPGGTVTLEFEFVNVSTTDDATGIFFTDSLPAGLTPASGELPESGCGGTLDAAGSFLFFTGGSVLAGTSCTFDVILDVPAAADPGTEVNITSVVSATIGGSGTTRPAARDEVEIAPLPNLELTKEFTDDPVLPGNPVTLEFTLTNDSLTHAVDSIGFTDDLSLVAAGLTLGSVDFNDCGGSVTGVGTSTITFSGGSLAAGSTCTIMVTVDTTAATPAGTHGNTTSAVSGSSDTTEPISGAAASDDLVVSPDPLVLAKEFVGDPVEAGATVPLKFTIRNLSTTDTITSIGFTDDLATVLVGLKGTGLPIGPVCGGGTLSGSASDTFLTFAGGSLAPSTSCTFTVTLQVPATAGPGTYPNTTSAISGDAGGPVGGPAANDSLSVVEPTRTADLSITKIDAPDPVVPGTSLTYTIEVFNAGPDAVTSATVTDTLPAGVTFVSTSGCAESPGGGVPTCTLGTIGVGASKSYTITVDVVPDATGSITNTATASALITDPDTTNNSASATTTLFPEADVSVTKDDGVTSAVPGGDTVTYTIVVANAGPSDDPAVTLDDTFPAELTCTWTSAAAGGATGNTAAGSGDLAETLSMPAGSSVTYTVDCTIDPSATGTLSNTATATASVADPVPGNDSATDDDTVLTPEADVSVTKDDGVIAAIPGSTTVYTIVVANAGPSDDPAVTLDDTFPAELTCTWTSTADGGATGNTAAGSGDLAETLSMPVGSSITYTVVCDIASSATGTLSNTATAAASVTDPDPGNDSATDDDTMLVPNAHLAISKVDDVDPVVAGTTVTYTITVENFGPSDATGVTVVDTVPAGLMYLSDTAGSCTPGDPAPGFVTCDLGTTAVGDADAFEITFSVDPAATGTLTNEVSVTSDATDPDTSDNTATEDTAVVAVADLAIAKDDGGDPAVAGDGVIYTFTVDNFGPSDAIGVTVVDEAPPGMMFDSATAPCTPGDPAPGFLTCDLGDIPAGFGASFDVSFFIDPAAPPGTVTNEATVASDATDPDLSDNTATDDTEIVAEADLAIFKVGDSPVAAGDTVTYSFTVDNLGLSDATGVTVVDEAPPGMMFDSATVPCTPGVPAPGFLTCDLGDIPAGGSSGVFEITFTIDPAAPPGTVTNSATVSSDATDPDLSDNTATADTEIVAEADLAITKVDTDDPVLAGESVTYEIVVENFGPSDATGVTVVDEAPPGMMFSSADVPCTPGVPAPGFLTCDLGTLPAGFGITFEVTFDVDPAAPAGDVDNEVTVSSDAADPVPGDNTATETTTIAREADLSIEKEADPDPVTAGETLTYTITVDNFGPSDATGVTVIDTLPAGVTYVSDTDACVEAPAGRLTCDLGTIPMFGSESFDVTVAVGSAATGTLVNEATVSSDDPDPDTSDNTATTTTAVATGADLAITKTDAPDPVVAGESLTYTITVSNAGPSDATGVVVSDTLPAGVTYVSDTDSCVEAPAGTLTCSLGTIAAGDSASFTITVDVDAGASGTLTNTATVSSAVADADTSDNTATATTRVEREADLAITKTDSPDPVRLGEVVTYTVTVTNNGPSNATGVKVTDRLPAGVVQARTSGCAEDDRGVPTCSLGTIAAGASKSYTITARVTGNTTRVLVNTAAVSASTTDPDTSDNSATAFTTVSRPQQPEVGLFDPVTGHWTQLLRNGSVRTFTFGNPGDYGIVGDWDGDGDRTPGVLRTLNGDIAFFARNSNSSGPADFFFVAGEPGDIPVAGDWNGNGRESLALFRPSTATWYVFFDFADVVPDAIFVFGNPGDDPSSVDIDGDGDSDPVAYRDMGALGGHVFVRRSLSTGTADGVFIFGNPGDNILFGDYDYDGRASVGTYRPGDATFYLRNSNTTGVANLTIPLGIGRELPYAGPF